MTIENTPLIYIRFCSWGGHPKDNRMWEGIVARAGDGLEEWHGWNHGTKDYLIAECKRLRYEFEVHRFKRNGTVEVVQSWCSMNELTPSFWFMREDCSFLKPAGNSVKDVRDDLIRIAKENTCGMVCRVLILNGDKEVRRVGINAHVDRDGKVDLTQWYEEAMKDIVVQNFNKQLKTK